MQYDDSWQSLSDAAGWDEWIDRRLIDERPSAVNIAVVAFQLKLSDVACVTDGD